MIISLCYNLIEIKVEANMTLKKCENCGVFFGAENGETLCNKCTSPGRSKAIITGDIEHDKFANARAAVYDQPNITPEGLVEELKFRGIEITVREIMKYVVDGRLTLVTVDGGNYCISCGAKIGIGTMCADCSDKLDKFRKPNELDKKPVEKPKKDTHGMHIKHGSHRRNKY